MGRALPPEIRMTDGDGRFRAAALAYFAYGIVYYVGGLYLIYQGVGVMGGGRRGSFVFWSIAGLVPLLLIPYLVAARRRWFERWVITRRDFTRLVAIFLAIRALLVGQTAFMKGHGAAVAAPWGGVLITFQVGAMVFLVVTLAALVMVVRAGWSRAATDASQ
jgi:hypothetical protein